MEFVQMDSSDESLAPAVSLPVVVALSRSNSVNAGDADDSTWPRDGLSCVRFCGSGPVPVLIG